MTPTVKKFIVAGVESGKFVTCAISAGKKPKVAKKGDGTFTFKNQKYDSNGLPAAFD